MYVDGDNMSVINNTSKPESTLKKKCNTIAYHAFHEYVAMRESLIGHRRSEDNPADLLTMVKTRQKRNHLVPKVLYNVCDEVT